ncbi:MAG: REP-associated tyrosine transposase [Gammaproteobacteria bacterium]
MVRPLRIEFSGALYHVTSRGDRRETIFEEEADFGLFLDVLAEVVDRFNWLCHAYCLMTNHYHLVIETPDGNLAKGMRHLNGVFTQASNRKYSRSGHLFQGRYKAILVDSESYLLELARYVVLNPVRAGMVEQAEQWLWSSYRATVGLEEAPAWLTSDALLAHFGPTRGGATVAYSRFVASGVGGPSVWEGLRHQIYLGDDQFVERMQASSRATGQAVTIPRAQRRPPPAPLEAFERRYAERNQAIVAAYRSGAYSYQQIADHFGIHPATVGRVVRAGMQQCET